MFFTNPESTNLRFFFHKYLEGCKVSFFIMIQYVIENFYLVQKQNKGNFVEKFCRFRNRENMWWAWPWRIGRKLRQNMDCQFFNLLSCIWRLVKAANTVWLSSRLISSSSHRLTKIQKKTLLVFCLEKCSDLQWEKIVLVIEKNFWDHSTGHTNFWKRMLF